VADLRSRLFELYSLEQLSCGDSFIHRLHPLAKIIVTLVFIIAVAAHDRYAVLSLLPYFLYPLVVMNLAKIPLAMIASRAAVSLPFCAFAAVSNIFIDREPMYYVGGIVITGGIVSGAAIMVRAYLCTAAVLILVAASPIAALLGELIYLRVPKMLVLILELVYRYSGVLMEEAHTMLTAYRLRNPSAAFINMRDMASFIGQLFLRSMARAERIYQAMLCRGYNIERYGRKVQKFTAADWLFLAAGSSAPLILLMAHS
jgi:cobalt/nickel transport system permease protein